MNEASPIIETKHSRDFSEELLIVFMRNRNKPTIFILDIKDNHEIV